jgi:hypothetical protein
MERQGYDASLHRYPEGWRAAFLPRDHMTRPWVGQVLSFHATPWRTVQVAAWEALKREGTGKEPGAFITRPLDAPELT